MVWALCVLVDVLFDHALMFKGGDIAIQVLSCNLHVQGLDIPCDIRTIAPDLAADNNGQVTSSTRLQPARQIGVCCRPSCSGRRDSPTTEVLSNSTTGWCGSWRKPTGCRCTRYRTLASWPRYRRELPREDTFTLGATHGREINLLVNRLPHRNIARRGDDVYLTEAANHVAMLLGSNPLLHALGRGGSAQPAMGCPICTTQSGGAISTLHLQSKARNGTDATVPRFRLGRLGRFARGSMTAALNAGGVAHEVIHRLVLTCRTVKYEILRN